MCEKAADTCHFMFDYVPNCCKTQEMCWKANCKEPFVLKFDLDKSRSQ